MNNSRKYKRRRKNRLPQLLLVVVLTLGTVGALSVFANKFVFNNKAEVAKQPAKQEQQQPVEPPKPPEPLPTEYKKGTSHNIQASSWAYKTKDVNNWMLNPSSYTGTDKIVFLTFDDGPSVEHTNTILDILKNYGVHATFFIIGKSADQQGATAILKREIEEGHAVGLHSYSHDYHFLYPGRNANPTNILAEVEQNLAAIRKSLGNDFSTKTLRYPGGHMSWKNMKAADDALAQKGIYNIDWNAMTGDAEPPGSVSANTPALQHIKNDLVAYGNPKISVVLMHDIKTKSIDALPQIIEYYRAQGYKFGILE